jgi:hypothetical protein
MKEAPKPSAIIVEQDNSHLQGFFVFEVKLIVSIPNYLSDDYEKEAELASPIPEILEALSETEVEVLGFTDTRLNLIPAKKAIS